MIVVIRRMFFLIKVANYPHHIHVNIVIIINRIVRVDIVYHHHRAPQRQANENQVMIQMVAILNEGNPFQLPIKYIFPSSTRKTKTTQEKSSLPDTNRFTSPITAFRRKKKTPGNSNDAGNFDFSPSLVQVTRLC